VDGSGFQSLGFVAVLTQGVALGWDMAAPLALSKGNGELHQQIPFGNGN